MQHDDKTRPALGAAAGRRNAPYANGQKTVTHPDWIRPPRRRESPHRVLAGLEWIFLIVGLVAVDCYIWVNAAATIDQAYSDWAFDQNVRGVNPTIPGFVQDELGWLLHRNPPSVLTPQENAEKAQPVPPSVQNLPPGTLIGRLRIPRLNLSVMVREGATESTLRRAVGHIPGTGLPGRTGNVGLAGHRDTFFRPLQSIRKDDTIDLDTGHETLRYLVTSTKIVSPRDVEVLKASTGKTLTLVTCYPFYYVGSAPKRFIVQAAEVSSDKTPEVVAANAIDANGAARGNGSRRIGSKRAAYRHVAASRRHPQQPGS